MMPLTPRQWDVVALVAEGHTNSEVAAKLGLTRRVIHNYMTHIYDRLGFYNRVEIALWYIRQGLNEAS